MEKQKKPKPIGLSMAKVILVVLAIIAGGILVWQWQWLKIAKYSHIKVFPILLIYHFAGLPDCSARFSVKEAILFAIQNLENKGVKNIKICEVDDLCIPLEAYFIYGKGDFNTKGRHYSTFFFGAFEDFDSQGVVKNALAEGAFVARGKDDSGNVFWYPEPGPDSLIEAAGTPYKFFDEKKLCK